MTSAPQSASSAAAAGAATHTPSSTTRRSASELRPVVPVVDHVVDAGEAEATRSRSTFFSTFPVALSGSSSTISTARGTL